MKSKTERAGGGKPAIKSNVIHREAAFFRKKGQVDPESLTLEERVRYYEKALRDLATPWTFQERVLYNVLQCLLEQCQQEQERCKKCI